MMILNWKKPLVSTVYTQNCQRCMGYTVNNNTLLVTLYKYCTHVFYRCTIQYIVTDNTFWSMDDPIIPGDIICIYSAINSGCLYPSLCSLGNHWLNAWPTLETLSMHWSSICLIFGAKSLSYLSWLSIAEYSVRVSLRLEHVSMDRCTCTVRPRIMATQNVNRPIWVETNYVS